MGSSTTRRVTASVLSLACVAGLAVVATPRAARASESDPFAHLPPTISLTGVVRDFRKYGVPQGHPDFERYNTGHRVGIASEVLDSDGKPTLADRIGRPVNTQYRDARGRNIRPASYNRSLGDQAGSLGTASDPAVTSAESFSQWFRDVPGVNLSKQHTIELVRQPNSDIYVFHEHDDEATAPREGFFPADGDLYNDIDPTYRHNYHFTFELATTFVYKRGTGQVFTFVGDDDVWVYIDGKLAIDVGGVHSAVEQTVDLDRFADLHGLQDGEAYSLKFFFAERRTTRSNCRIETTLHLRNADLPSTSALYD